MKAQETFFCTGHILVLLLGMYIHFIITEFQICNSVNLILYQKVLFKNKKTEMTPG